jgi:Skp family chaperone for outer membrane proteins
MKTLFDKIQTAVAKIAEQKGLDLVLAEAHPQLPDDLDQINVDQLRAVINSRNILYSNSKVDISDEVIALLDAEYKAKK